MSQNTPARKKFPDILKPSEVLSESTPTAGSSKGKTPLRAVKSPSIDTVPQTTALDLPLSEEQIDTAVGMVIALGYRDIPRPPLRTLRILKETCRRYDSGLLDPSIAERIDDLRMREELGALLEECNADEVLKVVPSTLTGKGTDSTSPGDEPRRQDSQIITEIPSGLTQTDFQRQLAQTFADTSAAQDFSAAHDTRREPLPAPRLSYGTWHNLATGTQGQLLFPDDEPRFEQVEPQQDPRDLDDDQQDDQPAHDESSDEEPAAIPIPPTTDRPARDPQAHQQPQFQLPRERDRHRHRQGRGGPPPAARGTRVRAGPPPNAQNPAFNQGPERQAHYRAPANAPNVPLPDPAQPPPLTREETQLALSRENKLNIRDPEPFTGKDRRKWKAFLTECLMTFAAKPHTYGGDRPKVIFAASYLTELAQKHYITLLQFQPHHPALYHWADFVQEFGNMFGNLNAKLEAERALARIKMKERDNFHHHLTRFEVHAYESGWNFEALRFALQQSLPRRLKSALATMERRPGTYQELRQVLSNLDQSYWESQADEEEEHARAQRQNPRGDANLRTSSRAPSNDSTPRAASNQRPTSTRPSQPRPAGPRPTNNNATTPANPISSEERERRRREGLCIRCAAAWSPGHTCASRPTAARAAVVLGDDDDDDAGPLLDDDEAPDTEGNDDNASEENLEAIQELPGEA